MPGTRVLVPGYEGISAGIIRELVPVYEGISAGVRGCKCRDTRECPGYECTRV